MHDFDFFHQKGVIVKDCRSFLCMALLYKKQKPNCQLQNSVSRTIAPEAASSLEINYEQKAPILLRAFCLTGLLQSDEFSGLDFSGAFKPVEVDAAGSTKSVVVAAVPFDHMLAGGDFAVQQKAHGLA